MASGTGGEKRTGGQAPPSDPDRKSGEAGITADRRRSGTPPVPARFRARGANGEARRTPFRDEEAGRSRQPDSVVGSNPAALTEQLLEAAFRWAIKKGHPLDLAPDWYVEARNAFPEFVQRAGNDEPIPTAAAREAAPAQKCEVCDPGIGHNGDGTASGAPAAAPARFKIALNLEPGWLDELVSGRDYPDAEADRIVVALRQITGSGMAYRKRVA